MQEIEAARAWNEGATRNTAIALRAVEWPAPEQRLLLGCQNLSQSLSEIVVTQGVREVSRSRVGEVEIGGHGGS